MLFIQEIQDLGKLDNLSLRLLATLGDAVTNLFEKERLVLQSTSPKRMHNLSKDRVNARAQCRFLEKLSPVLTEKELDLVRRARNLKVTRYSKIEQSIYRQATAFEVLIGYLYLSNHARLRELLELVDKVAIDS